MRLETGAPSMTDVLIPDRMGRDERLERLDAVIDWDRVDALLADVHSSRDGRPAYPPLLTAKVMLLQQWHNASDPEMEDALYDRLSFRRFVGLGFEDATPDHSTISRFRTELGRRGLARELFADVHRQLDDLDLVLKHGTIMDATLVDAQRSDPPFGAPEDAGDADAGWTKRGRSKHYGYKVHIGMDQTSCIVREAALTAANINESDVAEDLVSGDEAAVYGDRAYYSRERSRRLRSRGVKDRIMKRASKHNPELRPREKTRNLLISRLRAPVEKVFGTLKRSCRYERVRYEGLARNETEMLFKLMAYNLRRADVLLLQRQHA